MTTHVADVVGLALLAVSGALVVAGLWGLGRGRRSR